MLLTLCMVMSLFAGTTVTASAAEDTAPTGCTHQHDESCGYAEAVAEVPCDKDCTDTDGDGVTDHAEDCAYTPAVEGQPCNHVYDENCGGLTADPGVQYEEIAIAKNSLNGNAILGVTENTSGVAMDNYAYFYSESKASSGGLPNNGKLTMPSGISYTLAAGEDSATAYNGNDCIRLTASKTSQTMSLETIGVYQNIYVLATAGGPGEGHYADFTVTLTYTDGSKADTDFKLYDWYDTREVSGVEKYYKVQRMQIGHSSPDGSMSGGPVLHSATIAVDTTKLLKQITFTMKGKDGDPNNKNGLYCCIFAVTGATPAGAPEAPVATAATKTDGDTSGAFTANWDGVEGATGYRLDVATDRKFTNILSDYNNKVVEDVTSVKVEGSNIDPNTTYYYRVRAVNSSGQSLSSNRISTDLPNWLKAALNSSDYDKVTYNAETNTVTFGKDVTLKDTITLPTDDTTVINLGGSTVTAPAGKPAISADNGRNVELTVTGGGTSSKLVGNGTTESGNGAPVIDFSKATGSSKVAVGNSAVSGSSGSNADSGNGGSGGAGIAASNSTQVEVGSGATVTGGNGGDATSGTGGNGGAGISGGNVSVSSGGTVTGGNGGNGACGGGSGGNAGASGGTNGRPGSTTPTQYSVAYNANDGSGTVPTSVTQNRGSSVTVASGSGLWRTGYTFAGWNTVAKPTNENPGTSYDSDSTISTGATLYAQWTANSYTVKFNANGGTGTMVDQKFTYDAAEAPLSANKFTKTGYHFAGWATSAGGAVVYSDQQPVKNLASGDSVTLYAVWVQNVYGISGTFASNSNENVIVKLMRGNTQIGDSKTVSMTGSSVPYNGTYSFSDIPAGTYNIVATQIVSGKTRTVTALVVVTNSDQTVENITMPSGGSGSGGSSSSSGGSSSGNSSTISTPSAKNGTVSVSPKSASKGTTVTVTVTPDKGYVLETLAVTDASGKKLDLKNLGSGKYSFTMPASKVEVKATFMEDNTMLNYFVDVPASAYYYDAVLWAAEQGITGGTDATHFSPDGVCTRAQAVTFLWRAAGSPAPSTTAMPFTDVAADSYYYNAVLWAMENGITVGTSSTTFSPDLKCSRAHIMTFLWRSEKSPAAGSVNPFTDVSADAYYADAVLWAVKESVTNGTSSATFSPDADCTRAQIVTFIWRTLAR